MKVCQQIFYPLNNRNNSLSIEPHEQDLTVEDECVKAFIEVFSKQDLQQRTTTISNLSKNGFKIAHKQGEKIGPVFDIAISGTEERRFLQVTDSKEKITFCSFGALFRYLMIVTESVKEPKQQIAFVNPGPPPVSKVYSFGVRLSNS